MLSGTAGRPTHGQQEWTLSPPAGGHGGSPNGPAYALRSVKSFQTYLHSAHGFLPWRPCCCCPGDTMLTHHLTQGALLPACDPPAWGAGASGAAVHVGPLAKLERQTHRLPAPACKYTYCQANIGANRLSLQFGQVHMHGHTAHTPCSKLMQILQEHAQCKVLAQGFSTKAYQI